MLARAGDRFEHVAQHVLLPYASDMAAADDRAHERLSRLVFADIVAALPETWLAAYYDGQPPDAVRAAYIDYLSARLDRSHEFTGEASRARALLV